MDEVIVDGSKEEEVLIRHRKEKKDLQGKIQSLKKSVNKDKKKKKEITEEIARLEKEMQERHEKELTEIGKQIEMENDVTNGIATVSLGDTAEPKPLYAAEDPERKMSKAAKRRQKKSDANKAREALIREEKENNRFCARNIEAAKLKKMLQARQLKMFEIKPDGDCMYAAIGHQMPDMTVSSLRSRASDFMRSHIDDFIPFITDPNTGEMLTPEEYKEYCDQMENTSAWGGQPELRALSQVLKRKIEVLQAEGSPIIFGDDCGDDKPIILTYYRHYYGLGEHYNSVIPKTDDGEDEEEEEES